MIGPESYPTTSVDRPCQGGGSFTVGSTRPLTYRKARPRRPYVWTSQSHRKRRSLGATTGLLSVIVTLLALASSCGGYMLPAQTSTAEVSGSPSATSAQTVPDFTMLGFPEVLISQEVAVGERATVTGGAFTVEIPANAFDTPVRFEILTGPIESFQETAPATTIPVLAVAFRVTDLQTGARMGRFAQPVMLTASSPDIVEESLYYDIMPDGTYVLDPAGTEVQEDELRHPIHGATVGGVITVPEPVIE
jgi:hypothetical protein